MISSIFPSNNLPTPISTAAQIHNAPTSTNPNSTNPLSYISTHYETNDYNFIVKEEGLQIKDSSRYYDYYNLPETKEQHLNRPKHAKSDAILQKKTNTGKNEFLFLKPGVKVVTIKNKDGIRVGEVGIIAGLGGLGDPKALLAKENGECYDTRVPFFALKSIGTGISMGEIESKFPQHQGLTTAEILNLIIHTTGDLIPVLVLIHLVIHTMGYLVHILHGRALCGSRSHS